MNQTELIGLLADSRGRYSWFLGAGASLSAGLPTANDIVWDIKRRHYGLAENRTVERNDLQNPAIREKIESYMLAKGFPATSDPTAYSRCFELEFGTNYTRQSDYLQAMLSEQNSALKVGHRVFGALLSNGFIKVTFTTNFDTVIERAVAEVAGKALAPFHLEGTTAALAALNGERFPLYCKLHGDFRYTSIKNLTADLATQNVELGRCFEAACNRFGLVVAGYSGRDESVMKLMRAVLDGANPYPHGLYWLGLKGREPLPAVTELLGAARAKGISAQFVEIETLDSLLSRLWKQLPVRDPQLNAKISKSAAEPVSIPLPPAGTADPIVRLNAVPLLRLPDQCWELTFTSDRDWKQIRAAEDAGQQRFICTKSEGVWAWGDQQAITAAFGSDLKSCVPVSIAAQTCDLKANLNLKGFVERALSLALRGTKPLYSRSTRDEQNLFVDFKGAGASELVPLKKALGRLTGEIKGFFTAIDEYHPRAEPIFWAESVSLEIQTLNDRPWLVLQPGITIRPSRARPLVRDFLFQRRIGRRNERADEILSAWIEILLPGQGGDSVHQVQAFGGMGTGAASFEIGGRTAFSRRSVA
jgi:hypothetical protein